jgi:hypothetical protein
VSSFIIADRRSEREGWMCSHIRKRLRTHVLEYGIKRKILFDLNWDGTQSYTINNNIILSLGKNILNPASIFIRHVALMMEAASISVTSVNFYHTIRSTNPENTVFTLVAVRTWNPTLIYYIIKSELLLLLLPSSPPPNSSYCVILC